MAKIIAYHGSPERFSVFEEIRSTSGQLGANLGFWFTTNRNVAKNFANAFPYEMYEKIKKAESPIEKRYKTEKESFEITDQEKNYIADALKYEFEYDEINKDYFEAMDSYYRFYGQMNIPVELKDLHSRIKLFEQKYRDEFDKKEKEIRDFYEKNHGGSLYTCELNLGKSKTLNGEKIGTSYGRFNELVHYLENDYDSVTIKNADTGGGFADEIVVFENKRIKILSFEYI